MFYISTEILRVPKWDKSPLLKYVDSQRVPIRKHVFYFNFRKGLSEGRFNLGFIN